MSVFRASNAPIIEPARYPEGPTERLGGSSHPPPPRRGVALAVLLAMLALLVAAVAALIAWRALGLAETAYTTRQPTPPRPYAEEQLEVRAGCDAVTFLDLDEPRVGVPGDSGDLRYDSRCGAAVPALALGPGAATLSESTAGVTAEACGRAVRTSPLGPGLTVPARRGTILCVLTGRGLVRLVVDDVRPDGTAAFRATAWPAGS